MMRKKMSKRASKRLFRKTQKVRSVNVGYVPRGGIRL